MGTLMLILLGNGVVANVLRKRSKAEGAGWMVIAVMAGVFTAIACGSSDAHLNVAALVWGIGLSLGGTTGYAINPAHDFGPRLAYSVLPIVNKGALDRSYAAVPVLGPLIGGGWPRCF